MDISTSFDLRRSFGYRLTYVARLNERRFEAALAELDLSRLAWCVLCAIGFERLTRPSDIADYIGVDRAAISRVIGQMDRQGLITRRLSHRDGRGREVTITFLGRKRLEAGTAAAEENAAHLRALIGAEEADAISATLDRLIALSDRPLKGL